jgi:two-component system, OmpR family, KDP operon response regulator KdpE
MDSKILILIVEDDKPIKRFLEVSIETQGYKYISSETGQEAMALAFSYNPEVILLDLGLPDIDGIDLISKIKENLTSKIIVVSARDHEREKVKALDLGADDYLTKPFSTPELLARIRVAIRNKIKNTDFLDEKIEFSYDGLVINYDKRLVFVGKEEIKLTPIEYRILELLSNNAGRVLTHKFIIKEIWGTYFETDTQGLRVFMASIRKKIEKDTSNPKYIVTEVGIGYRLKYD